MTRTLKNTPFLLLVFVLVAGVGFTTASLGADANDPRAQRWKAEGWSKTDFSNAAIDYSEILSGGPPKDGIPPIDKPKFASQADVTDIGDTEPVITVALDDLVRAYPVRVLMWHEIVNDQIGDTPVSVTYCPLCNSAVVFDRRLGSKVLDFGTTGKLRNSDLVMYDRQTESWWQQFIGEAIVGEMTGSKLKSIPARMESYAQFKERHPDGQVLVPNNPGMRRYGINPYQNYDQRDSPYPIFAIPGGLPTYINPMARVVAFEAGGKPQAIALKFLSEKKQVDVDGIVLKWTQGQNSALEASRISEGRDVGNVTVQKRTDKGLEDIVYDVTFAFVVNAFHPALKIRQE